jgi:hypothetical protein
VAWHKSLGNTWDEAIAHPAFRLGAGGGSSVITVLTGGAGTPPSPPGNLGVPNGTPANTLQGFTIEVIPEPATTIILALGGALLGLRASQFREARQRGSQPHAQRSAVACVAHPISFEAR